MKRFVALLAAATTVLTVALATPAAALPNPPFGASIDAYAAYDGQDTCDPTEKPGAQGFRDILEAEYGRNDWGITRPCSQGGQSEHKEGRALDYPFDVNSATQKAQAAETLNWLLATDSHGNKHALARRFGIMYIIWNRQIWRAYNASAGWQPYSGGNAHTDHIHFSFSWAGARRQTTWWTGGGGGTAAVYGVLPDGRLTYTTIDAATGNRTKVISSSAMLGFTPVAFATLNFNTLLATDEAGGLHRVDIITLRDTVLFDPPVRIGGGWTHQLLTADSGGKLYGIAGGVLMRYDVTAAKPDEGSIANRVVIGSGYLLQTLTSSGPGWILGTTADGQLLTYKVVGANNAPRYVLRASTWQVFPNVVSPGSGVIYAQDRDHAMWRYLDQAPFDGSGADIVTYPNDPVDTAGWTQVKLSAYAKLLD